MAAIAAMKQEWRQFKDDRPGKRFSNHRRRMASMPTWHKVLRAVAGVALIAIGGVFCVLPGPGLLGIVFGLALLAGMSRWMAHQMDRIEPRMRAGLRRANRAWHALSKGRKAVVITLASVVVAMGAVVVWKGWVGPMVASYVG